MSRKAAPTSPILSRDALLASGRASDAENDIDAQVFRAHYRDWDAKASEAFVLAHDPHLVSSLRALLFRGRLDEAAALFGRAEAAGLDPKESAEVRLEQVRLHSLRGDWKACRELARAAAGAELAPVSRLALHQTHALAAFELGALDEAAGLLEKVESLATVFPDCSAVAYARILRIKIGARRLGPEAALAELEAFWAELVATAKLDRNLAQALLRAEIDARRLGGLPHAGPAFASLLIAEAMGETLYTALALLDCAYAFPAGSAAERHFRARLAVEAPRFERLRTLIAEIRGERERVSSSAAAFLVPAAGGDPFAARWSAGAAYRTISWGARRLVFHFRDNDWRSVAGHPRLAQTIALIGERGEVPKADAFVALFGLARYVPAQHESLLYGIVRRLKSNLGLAASSRDGRLAIDGTLFFS